MPNLGWDLAFLKRSLKSDAIADVHWLTKGEKQRKVGAVLFFVVFCFGAFFLRGRLGAPRRRRVRLLVEQGKPARFVVARGAGK